MEMGIGRIGIVGVTVMAFLSGYLWIKFALLCLTKSYLIVKDMVP